MLKLMGEKEDIGNLLTKQPLESSDSSILINLLTQLGIVAVLIMLFYIFRTKLLWLYSPNTLNREKHPAYKFNKRSNWYKVLFEISDSKLLPLIGLDSFMMLQTMKILYRICLYCGVITIPVLCFLYYFLGDELSESKSQLFLRLSILNLQDGSQLIIIPIFIMYIDTAIILYLIYLYYKKFITLRQSYLRKPALSTSIITVKKTEYETGTLERAYEFININRRTLYFKYLPSYIKTDEDFEEYVKKLGLGEFENVELVKDVDLLTKMSYERELCIRKFEKKLQDTYRKILNFIRNKKEQFKLTNEEIENLRKINPDVQKNEENKSEEKEISEDERIQLFNTFMDGFQNFKEKKKNVDLLDYYLTKLKKINKDILNEKEKIDSEHKPQENIVDVIEEETPLVEINEYEEDKEFLSFKEIMCGEKDNNLTSVNLPMNTRSGFVTFKSQHNASAISQSLISSQIFSVSVERAPAPRDVIWYNLYLNAITLYFTKIYSFIMFIVFNIFFLIAVIFIAGMAKVENLEFLFKFTIPEKFSYVKSTVNGILTPFIFNQLLNLSAIVIAVFLRTEGVISFSKFQLKLMHRYFIFLFFNGFVAFIISSSLFKVIFDLVNNKFDIGKFSKTVSSSISTTSVFFLNFSIQRCLTGNFFLLSKPVNLFIAFFQYAFRKNRSRREVIESQFPDLLNYSVYYPTVLLIFPICIIYLPIAPVALIVGALHFYLAYITLKNDFINISNNDYEAGGMAWGTCVKIILYSLLTLHLTMFCQIFVAYSKLLLFLVLIPFFVTIYCGYCFRKIFYKSSQYHPISMAEEEILDKFVLNAEKQRDKMLEDWVDTTDRADQDSISLNKLDISDKIELKKNYPYRDIMMRDSYSKFFFPFGFFRVIKSIEQEDKENLFKLRRNK